MKSMRRIGLLFFILIIGIFLGTLGVKTALLIIAPLFLLWMILWDERSYRRYIKQQEQKKQQYMYH